ncbi:MAG: quinol:cytochrome C oxidoreductase [Acidobacteria bacterium]|nr:quinol:cytochrome C oxidoreductase [Acidobacteriota bacterium]
MGAPEGLEERRALDGGGSVLSSPAMWVGVTLLGGGGAAAIFGNGGSQRFLQSYLLAFTFFLSLALGALFFVLISHLTRSGWSVTLRRLAEDLASTLWLAALLFVPIVLGIDELYEWAREDVVAHDAVLQGKAAYLNTNFFIIRWIFYFAVWVSLAEYFSRLSGKQDETGDPELTLRMERASAPGMLLFAVTITFASFDLLMSLDAHWFSTIFGVYFFSGSTVSFFALLAVVVLFMQRIGFVRHSVTVEHLHDVGKLTFAFVVFWAYIAFSQYMLIWYGNLPEETGWYERRQEGDWTWASLGLLAGHFLIPFLFLMSRHVKRRRGMLAAGATWVLLMHVLDLYWIIMPQKQFDTAGRIPLHGFDVLCLAGFALLFIAAAKQTMGRRSLIPERDPRLAEAMAFENEG